ncbi:MAG TPA: DUF302 domain-containing protein [Spirochaetes bacterium]|nr:DUF302 domain-containing protein [Spirochaetota bacterium]
MYQFSTTLTKDFETVVSQVTEELKKEGFGVLTEIDFKKTLKAKINKDMRPYKVLGACNPPLAAQALDIEPNVGLLLPCNVLVKEEEDNRVCVSFLGPMAMLGLVENTSDLEKFGQDVRGRLERVRDALT